MDKLTLEKISPQYFVPKNLQNSTIWGQNMVFEKGQKYLIIAPSGNGKSTLATAMLGVHFQYEGNIYYESQRLKSMHLEDIVAHRKQQVSLLFQDVRLIRHLTIAENILLRIFDKNKKDNLPKMQDYADRLGIKHLLDKKAENCSYGERQRSAIVRSLINPTDFLIYDECFSHLDFDNKKIAFDLIKEVAAEHNAAVLFFELNALPFDHHCQTYHL